MNAVENFTQCEAVVHHVRGPDVVHELDPRGENEGPVVIRPGVFSKDYC